MSVVLQGPAVPPVLGPENSLLRHGLECVARGSARYVPLVMVGRSDWGKSDCLDYLERASLDCSSADRDDVEREPVRGNPASGRRAAAVSRAAAVIRWDGRSLEKDLSAAIESDSLHRLHQRFVSAGLIIVDGLDRVTKQAVFQLFSALLDRAIESAGKVVVTLEHFPADVKVFPPALVSRLSAGLVVAMRRPEREARIDLVGPMPSLRRIVSTTARQFSLDPAGLLGPSRHKNVAHARSAAIFLARRFTGKSLVEIGRFFGGRDHTTVLHSIRVVKERYETDPGCQRDIDAITVALGGRATGAPETDVDSVSGAASKSCR